MTPTPIFSFVSAGAGANFDFQNNVDTPSFPNVLEQQIEDLEVDNANLENKLAAALEMVASALEQVRRLGAQRDTAKEAERVARGAFIQLSGDWNTFTRDAVRTAAMDDYERVVILEKEVEKLEGTIKQLRVDLTKANEYTSTFGRDAEKAVKEGDESRKQVEQLQKTNERLRAEIEHHKTVAENIDRTLNEAYADLRTADDRRLALLETKDRIEADNKDWQLQFEDLRQQWEQAQARIEELEEHQKALEQLDVDSRHLDAELEELQAIISGHTRTLIVKDERIAHLENQYQKERQRNLRAADAAAAASAVTSPIDETPPTINTLADSLQDELDAVSDDDDYEHLEHETVELSDVTEIANIVPIEPATRPDCTIDVNEAVSVSPINAAVPRLVCKITETGSVTPVERRIETASSGVQTHSPALTTEILHDATFTISPVAPASTPTFTTEMLDDATFAISPVEPTVTPTLTTVLLHEATFEMSPIAPVNFATTAMSTQTEAPKLTSNLAHHASIAVSPVKASRAEQSTTGVQTEAPKLSSNVVDSASIAVVPVKAETQKLTFTVLDSASIAVSPVNARAPILSTRMLDAASFAISPVEVEAQKLTPHIIDNASLAISPVDFERKPASSFKDVKVIFAEQPVEAKSTVVTFTAPSMTLGDIKAIFEEYPIKARPSKASTISTGAQTTELPVKTMPAPISVSVTPKHYKISLLQTVLPIVCLLLAISCLHLYIQLDAWRYANGVGYTYSNSGRTGAFGNGRRLFGFIPIAMDIGNSWWEEQIARYMSMAITSFESWAGIDYRPLY